MSSGGVTTIVPPQEKNPQAFKRAVRKIKCAAMVANLAKSWQGWATEHSSQQDSIPSGWMPTCIEGEENDEKEPKKVVTKLTVTPRVITTDNNSDGASSKIRACTVTKSIQPKLSECGGRDVVNAIRGKMESGPEESNNKPFLGNESPTRRRQMRALENAGGGGGGGGGGGAVQTRKSMLIGSQNGSVDAEDSGLEEDNMEALTEQGEIKTVNKTDRPKIKISTMGDIKSRWQQWSVQHVEGQKLNPFSEDFDPDYAMSTRLRKGDSGYGRPKDGSKTAERGDRAQKHVYKEMEEMVWIIKDMGIKDREGRIVISFGRLFDRYVKISDKVVGILLRCRKHKMVDFEGEMLWKGQDDHVIITVRETEEEGGE